MSPFIRRGHRLDLDGTVRASDSPGPGPSGETDSETRMRPMPLRAQMITRARSASYRSRNLPSSTNSRSSTAVTSRGIGVPISALGRLI